VHPAVSPGRALRRQAQHQLADLLASLRAAWLVRWTSAVTPGSASIASMIGRWTLWWRIAYCQSGTSPLNRSGSRNSSFSVLPLQTTSFVRARLVVRRTERYITSGSGRSSHTIVSARGHVMSVARDR